MSGPLLNRETSLATDQRAQATGGTLVSCVKNATDTKTQDYDAKEIVEFTRTDEPLKYLPISATAAICYNIRAYCAPIWMS